MSAYVVDRDHIRFLVAAADRLRPFANCTFNWYSKDKGRRLSLRQDMDLSEFGQMLWDENIKSIVAKYPDCKGEGGELKYENMPGPIGEVFLYQHPRELGWSHIDPVAVLKACSCYAYQSCEHDEWEESEAHAAIMSLEHTAINCLPGYDRAQWGAPQPDSQAVSIFELGSK